MIRNRKKTRRGFTFLEIMFVVVIIGILLALVGPRLVGKTDKARRQACAAQINGFSTALKAYEMDLGSFPKQLAGLIEADGDEDKWDGPYLDGNELPKDPWGQEYLYKVPGENNKKGFDLWSKGPDKQDGTEDDITNWAKKS